MQILLGLLLSLLAAGVAAALYAWLVWWLDRYEKEPWWLLVLVFLWGAVPAIVISVIFELILDVPISVLGQGLAYEVAGNSIVAPVVEEVAKGLAVFGVLLFVRREMDSVLDGIVYGAMAGLGFALTENLFYFLGSLAEGGWGQWVGVVFLRAVVFGLNHAFFTGITGAALGYARLNANTWGRLLVPLLGLSAAIMFHGIHNFGAALASVTCFSLLISLLSNGGGIFMLGVVIGLVWKQEKAWIETQLASEVGTTIRREVYELTRSYRKRFAVQFGALLRGDMRRLRLSRRLMQTATELAFKKHQLAKLGEEGDTQKTVANLRQRLMVLQAGEPSR